VEGRRARGQPAGVIGSTFAPRGMVCAVDHLAAQAGVSTLQKGGSAADAAVAASAVLAVTTQHMCGMGGDLFALVSQEGAAPLALNSSGRAGSGAEPHRLRAEGHTTMPSTHDIRSVPVPGCVDGWLALHGRLGRLELADVLAPAIGYASEGFPAAPLLAAAVRRLQDQPAVAAEFAPGLRAGERVRRPGVAQALRDLVDQGRDGFYGGQFGEGLLRLGAGEYVEEDLRRPLADWVTPLQVDALGHRLWTVPPNSQGYLTLAAAAVTEQLSLPTDPDAGLWAHLTVEAARVSSYDRLDVLHEHADGAALLAVDRLRERASWIRLGRALDLDDDVRPGGTMHLTVVDKDRCGVSLIQSNAAGFGSLLVEPATGIFLQNRGVGFSLQPDHPAEYGPGRRPPHTLAPALVTSTGNELVAVLGTQGGDSQPQVLLQLLIRLLRAGQSAGEAMSAPRWVLSSSTGGGFDTWRNRGQVQVDLEPGSPPAWAAALAARGHLVTTGRAGNVGHAQLIRVVRDMLEGASDARALSGAAIGC